MKTPSPASPPLPVIRPEQLKASAFYWPNLIAALLAAIAVAVGSIGPWIAFMGMTRNNIGSGADGTITLSLGIGAAVALFALLNFGRTETKSGRMVALGTVAGVAGVLASLIGVIDAREVASRKAEIFGTTIGPDIGWGLWMILIAGPVLAITSAIVVKQIRTIAKANAASAVEQLSRPDLGQPPAPVIPAVATPASPPTPVNEVPEPTPSAAATPPAGAVGTKGRSGLRRAAPWAGGAAALAAALAVGIWAGPHLTGGKQETPTAVTTTTTVTASKTYSSTTAVASPPPVAPFTTGEAKVIVDGQPLKVGRNVYCSAEYSSYEGDEMFNISIGGRVRVVLFESDSRVASVGLGKVNGETLGVLDGRWGKRGNATATKDGNMYHISGTATDAGSLQPTPRPFEIDVSCP